MDYLLDTDICIFFLKDQLKIAEKIQAVGVDRCYISEVTLFELTFGANHSKNYLKHIQEVKDIKNLYRVVPIISAIEKFGSEKSRLRSAGKLIPDFDLIIGCTAVANKMIMVTNNVDHLSRIDGIVIENWTDAEFNEFQK